MFSRSVIDKSKSIIDDFRSVIDEWWSKLWPHSVMTFKVSFAIIIMPFQLYPLFFMKIFKKCYTIGCIVAFPDLSTTNWKNGLSDPFHFFSSFFLIDKLKGLDRKKCSTWLNTWACTIKLFTVVIYGFSWVFVPSKPIQPSLVFVGEARSLH
jgi:hypothetical protein